MKKIFAILFLSFLCFLHYAPARQKIGLVLSGGGAKGFAHIGTLKMLDSLHIPVDYIVGTSMGGIVGGLYAMGYSGEEIEQLVRTTDWNEIFKDMPSRTNLLHSQRKTTGKYQLEFGLKGYTPVIPAGLIQGQKISLLLSRLTYRFGRVAQFDELPIPFRCVAVDIVTGTEVVFSSGSLARAMRATMSMPTVFSPVTWGDSLLIDGSILNNFPVDLCKSMGADIIIGVNVGSQPPKKNELTTALDVLSQTIYMQGYSREKMNSENAQILVTPDLRNYTAADFEESKVESIIEEGCRAAYTHSPEFVALRQTLVPQATLDTTATPGDADPSISKVLFEGATTLSDSSLHTIIHIPVGRTILPDSFSTYLSRLKSSPLILNAQYALKPAHAKEAILLFTITEKPFIDQIDITGNENLDFDFINGLLGIMPGSRFDPNILEQRIMDMYVLGYFETLSYDVEEIRKGHIVLTLRVKEQLFRKLFLGGRYTNQYQLVGILGYQSLNSPFSGARIEADLEFAGLLRAQLTLSYPSRSLDLPIYPYVRYSSKNVPVSTYDFVSGKWESTYEDRSGRIAVGIGVTPQKSFSLEAEYSIEYVNTNPNTGIRGDPTQFLDYTYILRGIHLDFDADILDDVLLPRKGFLLQAALERNYKELGSDLDFWRLQASASIYHTIARRHTLHLGGSYALSSDNPLPVYKYFYYGGIESFVGVNFDQLIATRLGIIRGEYRFEYKKDIFLKLLANAAFDHRIRSYTLPVAGRFLWGYGAGVQFLSIFGPIEIVYSRGESTIFNPGNKSNYFYFSAGYKF
jgi:predicted acylesterase/phospholipase RssA